MKFLNVAHIQHIPHFWTPYSQYTYSDSPQHRQFSPHTHFQYPLTYTPTTTKILIKNIIQKFFDSFLIRSGRKAQDTQISSIFSDSATAKTPLSHHFCPHPRHPWVKNNSPTKNPIFENPPPRDFSCDPYL